MADQYTSRMALVLDVPVEDVGEVVRAAGQTKDIDRAAPVRGSDPAEAQEVHWGGRMQKAVVRQITEGSRVLLRTEAYIGSDGFPEGARRQALLLQALSRQLKGLVTGVVDVSAMADRDIAWVNRLAIGAVKLEDVVTAKADGEGTWWARTHGLARFDVPDLEVYGLSRAQVPAAEDALIHLADQLLRAGLRADLRLPDDTPVRLVPVLEAWTHLPLDWPGVGRAGKDRGEGLDGPRAAVSIHHKPRFGRYRADLKGVVRAL